MKLQNNLFDLTPEEERMSKMMYNDKVIKCLVAPYHVASQLEIEYGPNVMIFPEKELTHIQTKKFISICCNSNFDEILIITASVDIIFDMIDDCVRILTEFDTIVRSPEKTFAANQHTIIYSILNNENHQTDKTQPKSYGDVTKVIDLINSNKDLTEDEVKFCEFVIENVGEPIISNRLKDMLSSKIGKY